jgi:type III pantothenate kinase
MSRIRLLIDLGNTRVKWVWARGRTLDTDRAGQGDIAALTGACRSDATPRPDAVLISSVASAALTRKVEGLCLACWGIEAHSLQSRAEQGGVRNAYAEPARLGVDRWLAIVGAVETYGAPLIVWDLGTATTLDAVDAHGQHLGGWIVPGPLTMLRSLRRWTQLPVPDDLQETGTVRPGKSTAECITRGAVVAQVGALRQLINDLSGSGGANPRLVVTGGAAEPLLPGLDLEYVHDPWLVFRGMLVD